MPEPAAPSAVHAQLVDTLRALAGSHPGFRAAHAKGIVCSGRFRPAPEARRVSRAPHLQGPPVPFVFRLSLQPAEAGDPTDDVTALWPATRPLVEMGTLDVTGVSPTGAADERRLVFDPTNRTDGSDLSADPILLARAASYSISYDRRSRGE